MDEAKTKKYFFLIALMLGFCHAISTRNVIDPDGLSYLDVGNAFFSQNIKDAVNPYWSPLFSCLQGFFIFLVKPDGDLEPTLVHLVNLVIFILSYFGFYYFLEGIIQYVEEKNKRIKNLNFSYLPRWAWLVIGNGLFLWSSTNLIKISILTPDLLISGILYFIFGILVRLHLGNTNTYLFVYLGIMLGLGYLAKAFMFPVSVLVFLLCCFLTKNVKSNFLKIIFSFLIFSLISLPFIFLVSQKQGHFTFGESGKLNWSWYMNESYEHWRGGWPGGEKLLHPAKKVFNEPLMYEFSQHTEGTYPFWYDPSYWFSGLKPEFNLIGQLRIILWSLGRYYKLFIKIQFILTTFLILFFFLSEKKKEWIEDLKENWKLLFLPVSIFGVYLLVATELRYLGGFIVVFWIMLFSSLKFPVLEETNKFITITIGLLGAALIIFSSASEDLLVNGKNDSAVTQSTITKELKKLGLKEKDKIGVIGLSYGLYWARLGKVQVIAEIPAEEENVFWSSDSLVKTNVLKEFSKLGAKMVIADNASTACVQDGWKKIKNTPYYVYVF